MTPRAEPKGGKTAEAPEKAKHVCYVLPDWLWHVRERLSAGPPDAQLEGLREARREMEEEGSPFIQSSLAAEPEGKDTSDVSRTVRHVPRVLCDQTVVQRRQLQAQARDSGGVRKYESDQGR